MLTIHVKKFAASCTLALTAALAFSQPAAAIPPPDVIKKCEKDERYQMHHWYRLYGEPQTIYLKRVDATPQTNPYMQSISEAVYHANCYLYEKPGDFTIAYERVGKINFREIGSNRGKPFVLDLGDSAMANKENLSERRRDRPAPRMQRR